MLALILLIAISSPETSTTAKALVSTRAELREAKLEGERCQNLKADAFDQFDACVADKTELNALVRAKDREIEGLNQVVRVVLPPTSAMEANRIRAPPPLLLGAMTAAAATVCAVIGGGVGSEIEGSRGAVVGAGSGSLFCAAVAITAIMLGW